MKQRGRYRACRAPRTNLFPGLARTIGVFNALSAALVLTKVQMEALLREVSINEAMQKLEASMAALQEMHARDDERRDRKQAGISDSINRWAGQPERTIRGAQASMVLIDETPLLRDVAVRRPWWKLWARG
ncbi:hypothetical protein M2390_003233 [Mycetocola sp. BIGb0189]|nr:hypothetical protein [Mycetocola sp. BIGb0189]